MDSQHIVLTKSITTAIEVTRLVLLETSKIFPGLQDLHQGRLIQMDIQADARGTFEGNPARRILIRTLIRSGVKVATNCNLIMRNGKEWDLVIVDLIFCEQPDKDCISFRCEILEDKVQIKHLVEFIR